MNPNNQDQDAPVGCNEHYAVFKTVEARVKEYLGGLNSDYLLVGLRVAYDLVDSSNEPDVLPYAVEFGYLEQIDTIIQTCELKEVTDEELLAAMDQEVISIELLDELFDISKTSLEEHANQELSVGVFLAVSGSPIKSYSVSCTCRYPRRKKYCSGSCYCTQRGC